MATGLDFVRSGSRVVALGYSSNGAKQFRTFHDQQLDVDCDFVTSADGAEQRCVPTPQVQVVYLDAECTRPGTWLAQQAGVQVDDVVSGLPAAAGSSCPGDAPPHRETYRVAEQLTEEVIGVNPPGQYEVIGGSCQQAQARGKVAPPVYRLIPLPEQDLVRGERVSLDVGEGMRLTRLVADDGAQLNLGVTDAGRTPCELQSDGECVPEPIARYSRAEAGKFWFALNADCSEPAYQLPYLSRCGPAKFGVNDDGVASPHIYTLEVPAVAFRWNIDEPPTQPVTYSCGPAAPAALSLGAPARDVTGTFPRAVTLQSGAGPLYVRWYSTAQNQLSPVPVERARASPGVVPSADFVDEAGKPCQIMPATDGTQRCVFLDDSGVIADDLTIYPEVVWGPL